MKIEIFDRKHLKSTVSQYNLKFNTDIGKRFDLQLRKFKKNFCVKT